MRLATLLAAAGLTLAICGDARAQVAFSGPPHVSTASKSGTDPAAPAGPAGPTGPAGPAGSSGGNTNTGTQASGHGINNSGTLTQQTQTGVNGVVGASGNYDPTINIQYIIAH